ncbi:MAG: glycogen/starch/alpha-glucan phosphorylase [Defluviitaleaceae bacterium]|nr:glycogen/starch/alpha-glucan phosphorylase [Defluviitaleaceae bacterium]MCL2837021.1 glycogen/starch/alpha-glucan phosphorylase [Defluviitaleaceae bacterium]
MNAPIIAKERLKEKIVENVKTFSRKTLETASSEQIYEALAFTVRDIVTDWWINTHGHYYKNDVKVVYYLSMEFLTGRFLGNTVINLTLGNELREALTELGLDYNVIEDAEADPGLGNGGLGRLAACFLDSLSTLGYPAYGCGIRYRYGIFEQRIENGYQVERPDNWLENGDLWGVKRHEYAVTVKFGATPVAVKGRDGKYRFEQHGGTEVLAVPYDYPVVGYDSKVINTLRLWEAEAVNKFDLSSFNKGDFSNAMAEQNLAQSLCDVLYPADDNVSGKELRLRQQYFFISATLQRVITRFKQMHGDKAFHKFADKVQFQLNDTHPTVAVAELMRILVDENGLEWDDAWEVTKAVCAYTNHTIMSEALEKWPVELFSRVLPRIYMIVEEINRRFCINLTDRFGSNAEMVRRMAIIADGYVKMAHLAIVGSHSVNGVAAIHSDILKKQELKDFYDIYPERFNNKTNGITQRRWLAMCNPRLSGLITGAIGDGWIKDLNRLKDLEKYVNDAGFMEELGRVKQANKDDLAAYTKRKSGISIDPASIFDMQVKRLHEYKRQLLNILNVLDLYNRLKTQPWLDVAPRTFIFSAKAAASYARAKLIIKLINNVANLVNNDPQIDGRIKVLFLENYRVSLAERLIPAADVSEQISTAGKEASGTGNMKFMLNGALTLGTMDGANVEIYEEVGDDNIFIFGLRAHEVQELAESGAYDPWDICNLNASVRNVMTMLINGQLSDNHDLFRDLYDALLNGTGGSRPDEYFVLKDFEAYSLAQDDIADKYKHQGDWLRSSLINIANAGKFSSDRTIEQYAQEIWNLSKADIN